MVESSPTYNRDLTRVREIESKRISSEGIENDDASVGNDGVITF